MKISGPTGPSGTTSTSRAGASRPSSGGFAVSNSAGAAAPAAASATTSTNSVADVSALMALQGVEGPLERRRRAVRRGGGLLDRLDELKLAMLSGEASGPVIERLMRIMREERPVDDDPGLTAVLDQIDLRAAVEMAKAEMSRRPA